MWRRETLTAHSKSRPHVVCHTRLLNDQKPENRPLQKIVSRISQESQARLEKLFNTAHLSIFGQVVLWFGQAKYTLYLSEGTSELERKFLALVCSSRKCQPSNGCDGY